MAWWESPDYINQIVDWAYKMQERFPEAHLVSIGQSPAWIIRSVSMIRKMRGEDVNLTYVPFTGGFVERVKDQEPAESDVMLFRDKENWLEHSANLTRYFKYMQGLGVHPDQLHERMENGEKFVFAEMIIGANGLASFMNVLLANQSQAFREVFEQSAVVFAYDTAPKGNKNKIRLQDGTDVGICREPLPFTEADKMQNTAPSNVVEEDSSRLLPTYRLIPHGSGQAGFHLIPNSVIRGKIEALLHSKIQYREHHL